MTRDEVRSLRRELRLTAKQLAKELGTDAQEIFDWESGERFPTKRHVEHMKALKEAAGRTAPPTPTRSASLNALEDPRLRRILRKLAAHSELLAKVERLAEPYDDPADD